VFRKSAFADARAVLNAAEQDEQDVVIVLDNHNTLTLKQTALTSLSADDFRFVA
jgi:hypothetical protein